MSRTSEHYRLLFTEIEAELGDVGTETSTGIVGFSAGGPVSLKRVGSHQAYVTCELSLYGEQVVSSEGEHFELLCRIPISESQVSALLTALGNLSMKAKLGHGHTVDVTGVSGTGDIPLVLLRHYSSSVVGGKHGGFKSQLQHWRSGQ